MSSGDAVFASLSSTSSARTRVLADVSSLRAIASR
jgi:hypothetical protein